MGATTSLAGTNVGVGSGAGVRNSVGVGAAPVTGVVVGVGIPVGVGKGAEVGVVVGAGLGVDVGIAVGTAGGWFDLAKTAVTLLSLSVFKSVAARVPVMSPSQ